MTTVPAKTMRTKRNLGRSVSLLSVLFGRSAARKGFTLIELLIVVVIISILAAIAIPKFTSTKEKAYVAKMKGDLRNLATAQESHLIDNLVYYAGVVPSTALFYNPSPGVTIVINEGTNAGWAATASYPGQTPRTCALFSGVATPPPPATVEGAIVCTP
ncbi:MAG: prepilin-type N-terminal cleavage/methylation domain-containing protein [Gemmatimonadetes bacterium]|nr:prepilin-type N-terminal cleavage/methylation domain-containing protein [Gemmatimonadota bacterium]